jgi:hypothetical protein
MPWLANGIQQSAAAWFQELGIVSQERNELKCALRAGVVELVDAADSKWAESTPGRG